MPGRHFALEHREVLAQRTCRGEHPDPRRAGAAALGCHRSTVYREWRRNGQDGDYFPARAQATTDARRRASKSPWKMNHPPLAAYVQEKLSLYWSPQQISGRLKVDFPDEPAMRISHQAIYEWIAARKAAGGCWHTYLRQGRRRRRKRYGTCENRGRIVGRVGIESRPAEVAAKSRLGGLGKRHHRRLGQSGLPGQSRRAGISQYTVLAKLHDGKAASLNDGTVRAFARHGNLPLLTTTADNGKEFAAHAELTAKLGLDVYFARPYHAWERGLNENTNGLVRQFFPKGLDLTAVTDGQVRRVERLLNTRPRKTLGYRTPLEMLRELSWP
jgi:IS30 family transposase